MLCVGSEDRAEPDAVVLTTAAGVPLLPVPKENFSCDTDDLAVQAAPGGAIADTAVVQFVRLGDVWDVSTVDASEWQNAVKVDGRWTFRLPPGNFRVATRQVDHGLASAVNDLYFIQVSSKLWWCCDCSDVSMQSL
jgi:hypothetical protein